MKAQIQNAIQCDPSHVNFLDLPMFGEVVLRLRSSARTPPRLLLMREGSDWTEFSMVREQLGSHYVALRLTRGTYFYQFAMDGVAILDPANPGPVIAKKGVIANLLHVSRGSRSLTFMNQGTTRIRATLDASPPLIAFAPQEISISPRDSACVSLTPLRERLVPVKQQVLVQLRDTQTSTTLCQSRVTIDIATTVPSMSVCTRPAEGNKGLELEIRVRGQGNITCHVVDRITPRIEKFKLSCPQQIGYTGVIYRCSEYSREVAKALLGLPCFLVFTDSPFPDERLWQVHADGDGTPIHITGHEC